MTDIKIGLEYDKDSQEWVATADWDGSPQYDGSGTGPLAAAMDLSLTLAKTLIETIDVSKDG